jgi:hypothetical protein
LPADLDSPGKVDTKIRAVKGSEVSMGRETTRLRRTFALQFKKDAVRLVTEEGKRPHRGRRGSRDGAKPSAALA